MPQPHAMITRFLIALSTSLYLPGRTLADHGIPKTFHSVAEAIAANEPVRILDLSGQGLTEVPDTVWKMRALEQLYLNDNHLQVLPGQIGKLRRLKVLDLSNNHLSKLPPQLCRLSDLESISIVGNPIASHLLCLDHLPHLIRYEILPAMPDSQRALILDTFLNNGAGFIFANEEPVPLNWQTVCRQAQQTVVQKQQSEKIVLRILVSDQGYYLTHRIISGADLPELQQIEAALPMLVFVPAYRDDGPTYFWVNVTL
ncbi:MAG: leucine-rich repeat domain-containing protein [Bacteroidetes bacterium]|nr:MAG: leucine-rich repeat domain-containing protein [Bacteroidota bacterium]